MNILMIVVSFLILFIGLIYFGMRWYKIAQIKRNHILQQTPLEKITQEILQELYHDVNGATLSQSERQRLNIDAYSLVYGEIDLPQFQQILAAAKPQVGEVFYDLGSGTGKAVLSAALLYDLKKVCGIELLPALYQSSQQLQQQLLKYPRFISHFPAKQLNVNFINDDIFNSDFADADIVFINATGFFGVEWQALSEKLTQLKTGARIIVTSKKLGSSSFKLIHGDLYRMSWGICAVNIYEKI